MNQDRIPRPGEIYRHFKNRLYQILTVAIHSETGERMVVYQALYGDFKAYVRPLTMFISEVDLEKYPNVKQKYRFERVDLEELVASADSNTSDTVFYKNVDADLDDSAIHSNCEHKKDTVFHTSIETQMQKKKTMNQDEDLLLSELSHKLEQELMIHTEGYDKSVDKNSRNQNAERNETTGDNQINDIIRIPNSKEYITNEESNEVLFEFLDAKTYQDKLTILTHKKKYISDKIVNDMAVSLDCTVPEGTLEDKINSLVYCLQTLARFENKRFR